MSQHNFTSNDRRNDSRPRARVVAIEHGLTAADTILIPGESRDDFLCLAQAFRDRFQPADMVEDELVQQMIAAAWRLRRAAALEAGLFRDDRGLLQSKSFEVLSAYESRIRGQFDRALKTLLALQTSRPTPPDTPKAARQPKVLTFPAAIPDLRRAA